MAGQPDPSKLQSSPTCSTDAGVSAPTNGKEQKQRYSARQSQREGSVATHILLQLSTLCGVHPVHAPLEVIGSSPAAAQHGGAVGPGENHP